MSSTEKETSLNAVAAQSHVNPSDAAAAPPARSDEKPSPPEIQIVQAEVPTASTLKEVGTDKAARRITKVKRKRESSPNSCSCLEKLLLL